MPCSVLKKHHRPALVAWILSVAFCLLTASGQTAPLPNSSTTILLAPVQLSDTAESPTKIGCVGDSITAGHNTYGYPTHLDGKLSSNYTVVNYGVAGTTALFPERSNYAYTSTEKYQNALASGADIVVVMLGTNDSKDVNWKNEAFLKDDLRAIVNSFLSLSPAPKVYLATPIPGFGTAFNINPDRVETLVGPRVRDLANELNVQGIDTFTSFIGRDDLFVDGIHPNSGGRDLLAQVIQNAITAPDDDSAPSAPASLLASTVSETSIHLTWSASSGTPTGYEVYRDGACAGVVGASNCSFDETGLTPGTYSYTVRAFDRALNLSTISAAVTVDTRIPTPDEEPPSVPANLTGVASGSTITLNWAPSTDNLGVSGYEVKRGSTVIDDTTGTSFEDTGLIRGNTYDYSVRAFDAIGNCSEFCTVVSVELPETDLPEGWEARDIGSVGLPGSSYFASGTFTLKASGMDIYSDADSFGYTYTTLSGDGSITARVTSMDNTNEWAKCGVMFRETLDAGSKHASMVVTPGRMVSFQRRTATGGNAQAGVNAAYTHFPIWIRVVRGGDTITGFYSSDGSTWTQLYSLNLPMASNVHVGLALCSHNNTTLNTAIIDNVTIVGGEINQPPVLQGIGNHTLRAGETIRFTIQATDPDTASDALQYSAEGL